MFSHACLVLALVLTLVGVWVQWQGPHYCMSTEEAVKSRRLTQDQGERRLRRLKRGGRWLLLTGMGLLVGAMAFLES